MRRLNMSRKAVTLIVGLVISLLGVLSSLSQGAMEITIMGDSFLDFIDAFTGNLLLPLSALITVLFVSWTWKKEDILTHTDTSGTAWSGLFIFTVKFIAPIAILVVLTIGILNW